MEKKRRRSEVNGKREAMEMNEREAWDVANMS